MTDVTIKRWPQSDRPPWNAWYSNLLMQVSGSLLTTLCLQQEKRL